MMPEQADDPDNAVERLESALERIARLAGQPAPLQGDGADIPEGPLVPAEEIASRLDDLIDRLRVALSNNKAG